MGLIDDIVDSCKKTVRKAWAGTKKLVKDSADYVCTKVSKTWNALTGKDKFKQAEELLNKIEEEYSNAKLNYEKKVLEISSKIEKKIFKINYHKKDIYDNHFTKFVSLGNKLHNISIKGKNFLEYFDDSITQVKILNGVRSKNELYMIDFNNLKFTEIALGFLTLGFFTRKKANQTLFKVQEEEMRINEEIQKMEAQLIKAQVILESIDNVDEYFCILIQNYSRLLDRFEYGIKSQIQKNILKGDKLDNGKLNFKMMPIAHIEEFQALFNLSIVLKQMASLGYLSEDGKINDEDIKSVENIKNLINNSNLLAA